MKKKKGKRILAAVLGMALAFGAAGKTALFIKNPDTAFADMERSANVKATTLNVRSGAGTGNSIVARLDYGTAVTVTGETTGSDGARWYEIRFSSGSGTQTGYVSSEYIKFPVSYTTDASFEAYLNEQGFPESYKDSLRTLHAEYPTWVFQAQKTGLDWNDVIANEGAVGANLVDKNSISSWKSTEYGAYDWGSGVWTGFDGATWVAASRDIVCYYMDPRNFLNETYIFQFLLHTYDSNHQTKEGLQSLIKGTFLEKAAVSSGQGTAPGGTVQETQPAPGENYGPGFSASPGQTAAPVSPVETTQGSGSQGNVSLEGPSAVVSARELPVVAVPSVEYGPGMDASAITGDNTGAGTESPVPPGSSYADIIMAAAAQSGVNPYVLAAMIIQEQGAGTSGSISGKTPGYEGYYNFFNIGAYDSGTMSAVTRGLWYASQNGSYGRPWNSIEKSIVGGAQYYGDNYVKQGQDTFYLKKFNVQGTNLYKHQYMTNVEGAAGEGAKLSRAYTDDMKSQTLVFKIPIYNNMPETACAKPTKTGSPNNKLASLEVTGYALTPTFGRDTESYDIIVNPSVDRIEVKAGAIDSKASVSGTGTISLQSGANTISVTVTAENGDVRTYRLNVVRQSDAPVVTVPDSGTGGTGTSAGTGTAVGPGGQTGPGAGQTGGPGAPAETTAAATQGVQTGVGPGGSTTQAPETTAPVVSQTPGAPAETQAPETAAPTAAETPAETQAPAETTAAEAPPQTEAAQGGRLSGDVNGDGSRTVLDVMLIKQHILGETTLSGDAAKAADLNGDGTVNAADMAALQKIILENG